MARKAGKAWLAISAAQLHRQLNRLPSYGRLSYSNNVHENRIELGEKIEYKFSEPEGKNSVYLRPIPKRKRKPIQYGLIEYDVFGSDQFCNEFPIENFHRFVESEGRTAIIGWAAQTHSHRPDATSQPDHQTGTIEVLKSSSSIETREGTKSQSDEDRILFQDQNVTISSTFLRTNKTTISLSQISSVEIEQEGPNRLLASVWALISLTGIISIGGGLIFPIWYQSISGVTVDLLLVAALAISLALAVRAIFSSDHLILTVATGSNRFPICSSQDGYAVEEIRRVLEGEIFKAPIR